MSGRRTGDAGGPAAEGGTGARPVGDAGVLGTALGVVLAFSFAEGSWQWFSTYLGITLLTVVLSFGRVPVRTPGSRAGYGWSLTAYSLVVGLCVALALAPALQRWRWLFPMPGTRQECGRAGRYESLHTQAALGSLSGQDAEALAYARHEAGHQAVADCLAATTTLWLPAYALGAALLTAAASWFRARTRARGAADRTTG
ncbi:hypothetical protein [Kitasatospora sp. NBC_01539]|uniref:hypothetical protein n=1 Tax=Kitasatospora sp. NBC_01539 TaxID=2903577 RepID=UPI0038602B2C